MKIVIFTGAGISAESGLGTFRNSGGLWEKYAIEDVATPEAWNRNPKLVLDFYNQRRSDNKTANPNQAHLALKELESYHEVHIITQNIDDLHERAKSKNILHLHGEIMKAKTSEFSENHYPIDGDIKLGDLGKDGLQLRPHVVWFGEAVPELERAILITEQTDIFIIIGTSLNVYPAASLVNYVSSESTIILIDPEEIKTPFRIEHIKASATIGVPLIVKQLIKKGG